MWLIPTLLRERRPAIKMKITLFIEIIEIIKILNDQF